MQVSNPAGTPANIAQKLRRVVGALQWTALAYLLWVLWVILKPLSDPAAVLNWLGKLAHRPLGDVNAWQWGAYLLVDMVNWALLALAVVYCWRAMNEIKQVNGRGPLASRLLLTGAWLAFATEVASISARPLKSYIMTCCDAGAAPLVHWFLHPQDLLATLLCLCLLALAHVFSWKVYLAEENKGFI